MMPSTTTPRNLQMLTPQHSYDNGDDEGMTMTPTTPAATLTTALSSTPGTTNSKPIPFLTSPIPASPQAKRATVWWQSSVVRRSSSAVDEAVEDLTEKSRFLRSPRPPVSTTTRLDSHSEEGEVGGEHAFDLDGRDDLLMPTDFDGDGDRHDLLKQQKPQQQQHTEAEQQAQAEEEMLVAPFQRDEIQLGQLLGKGTFSCVYEVTGFCCDETTDEDDQKHKHQQKQKLRQDVLNAEPGSYALKHLKPNLLTNTKDFEDAATDICMEAKYLAALDHPGILKLRGSPWDGTAAFGRPTAGGQYNDSYFLLTDRLVETLAQRIDRWKDATAIGGDMDAAMTNTIACKTHYALQIAEALRYLHEQRIIFRDLKPSNIGFKQQKQRRAIVDGDDDQQEQQQDQIQLFDFGLCRELPSPSRARPYKYVPYTTDQEHARQLQQQQAQEEAEGSNFMDESWDERDESEGAIMNVTQQGKDIDDDELPQREEVFLMSGAGTQIYMGVEIFLNHRYNLKTDVYSWSMTVAEMFLLEPPLPLYSMEEHIQYVCKEGDRPVLESLTEAPDSLKELLEWAWVADVSERCSMAQVCDELKGILVQVKQEEEEAELERNSKATCTSSFVVALSSNICSAAGQIHGFVRSIVERTIQKVLSFFGRGNQDSCADDDDQSGASSSTALKGSILEDGTVSSNDEDDHDEGVSNDQQSHQDTNTNKSQGQQQQQQPEQSDRDSLFKRLASSASTTVMTDDECDDDEILSAIRC